VGSEGLLRLPAMSISLRRSDFMGLVRDQPWPHPSPTPNHRLPTARKRLAVPFRAAQTPSERSEFAQPDVALVLTALSYFKDGGGATRPLTCCTVLCAGPPLKAPMHGRGRCPVHH
jgi:hypothetical protein